MFEHIERCNVDRLGECVHDSPVVGQLTTAGRSLTPETAYVPDPVRVDIEASHTMRLFERAGPREKLYFHGPDVTAGIVTCGGLCPGLNNVIRTITLQLWYRYGVRNIVGFRYGYGGLVPGAEHPPMTLTPEAVTDIDRFGGTILGSSRGPEEPKEIVDHLCRLGIHMLFCVGGDGTQRGALAIHREADRRGVPLAVVGVPKTIDNDVAYCSRSFGFITAVEAAANSLVAAHEEARSSDRGVGLVKLMGREAGFIAAAATLAAGVVNLTLIPELSFTLDGPGGVLDYLERRLDARRHAVIAVAEGAGQDLFEQVAVTTDSSGNRRFNDIGVLLRDRIAEHFTALGKPVSMKYIDPSYMIRGIPANTTDAVLCDQFARHAVHAAMTGRTGMYVGFLHDEFIHVPTELGASEKRRVLMNGGTWTSVLGVTGQPAVWGAG
jgi:6-phosphofructokinase 1